MNVHNIYIKQKEMFRDLASKFYQIYNYLEKDSSDVREMAFKEMCKYDDLYEQMKNRIKRIEELYEEITYFLEDENV